MKNNFFNLIAFGLICTYIFKSLGRGSRLSRSVALTLITQLILPVYTPEPSASKRTINKMMHFLANYRIYWQMPQGTWVFLRTPTIAIAIAIALHHICCIFHLCLWILWVCRCLRIVCRDPPLVEKRLNCRESTEMAYEQWLSVREFQAFSAGRKISGSC